MVASINLNMPTPTEYLKHTSVIIVTGGSSGIGSSIIKAINNLAPTATVCNLSRSKPGDFFDQRGIHIASDLSDSKAVAAAAAQLNIIIEEAEVGEVLLINNSGFGDYGRLQDLDRTKQLQMIDLNVRAVVDLTAHLLPQMLERAARQLGTEVQRRAMAMATLLEPLLIVAMGAIVMLIVLAVLQPIIQLNTWVK